MNIANIAVTCAMGAGVALGCAGNAGEEPSSDELGVGESAQAVRGGSHAACAPKRPLGDHCKDCTRAKIGAPSWEPSGAAAIAGQVGSTSPDLFFDFLNGLVAPHHGFDPNDFIIGPVSPHAGPYDDELATLAIARGFEPKQKFRVSEFTAPAGIVILLNLVPSAGAPTGSSFDFTSGPIIPNAVFPLSVDGDLFRDGQLYDPNFDSSYGGYLAMDPPILVDGASHLPWFFGGNSAFGPPGVPAAGKYAFKLKVTDATGAGWDLEIPFSIKK
jgi:hypothetical protein